jgi:hypothetical protein
VVFPQPKNWNWQRALDASAERVGFSDAGAFDVGVYRRY